MARILVDLPDEQLAELAELVEHKNQSRAALLREAVAAYLLTHRARPPVDVFGLWNGRNGDGLDYQREMREEW